MRVHHIARRSLLVPALGLALAATVTACSSSSSSSSSSSTATTPATSPSASPSAPATTAAASPTASASSADASDPTSGAAAVAAIKKNWVTFFDGKNSIATKEKYVEGGSKFASVLQATASTGANASATVQSVTVTSPTEATVHYTVLLSGAPVLTKQKGTAVYQDGTWKVSTTSFCGLAALESGGKAPAGCS